MNYDMLWGLKVSLGPEAWNKIQARCGTQVAKLEQLVKRTKQAEREHTTKHRDYQRAVAEEKRLKKLGRYLDKKAARYAKYKRDLYKAKQEVTKKRIACSDAKKDFDRAEKRADLAHEAFNQCAFKKKACARPLKRKSMLA
jgi:hypothetical protein